MTDQSRDVILGRIEPAWRGHTDLGGQNTDLVTKAELSALKAELFKHTTQTLVWMSGINAATMTLILMLFRFLGGTP